MEAADSLGLLPDEFVPVDSFFTTYVNELSNRSKRHAEGAAATLSAPKHARLEATLSASEPMPIGDEPSLASLMLQQQLQQGGPEMIPAALPSVGIGGAGGPLGGPTLAQLLATQRLQQQLQGMGVPAAGIGCGALPAPSLQQAIAAATAAAAAANAPGQRVVTQPALGTDFKSPSAASPDNGGGGSGGEEGRGGRGKSHKQQEANKLAQQRYRERKKAKFSGMEEQINGLKAQLAAVAALRSRNEMLEGMNSELHTALVDREREVERLKLVLDVQAETMVPSDSHGDVSEGGETDGLAQGAARDGCLACDILPTNMQDVDFNVGFAQQITALREFMAKHRVPQLDPSGADMAPILMNELAQLVGRSCQLCQAALRQEGVKVIDLISRDPRTLSSVESQEESRKWDSALRVMRLSAEQQEALLLQRRAHLAKMRGIYQERQNLNMEAMGLMLPHHSSDPLEDSTVEGRLTSMSISGYLAVAKSSAVLSNVLDRIKDNLRREQRAVMDINCCTIQKILSPIQASLYMSEAYPMHCDALALSNVLAVAMGREDSGDVSAGHSGGGVGGGRSTTSLQYGGAGGGKSTATLQYGGGLPSQAGAPAPAGSPSCKPASSSAPLACGPRAAAGGGACGGGNCG